MQIKELEQKIEKIELHLNDKIFEVNNLKREVYEVHSCKAEIDNLNNVIKKKNQEINDLRLLAIEKEQMKVSIDSLEREKLRMHEYMKEKDRDIASKSNKILELEKRVNSMLLEASLVSPSPASGHGTYSSSLSINYENLLKHKDSSVQKLQYELELQEVSLQTLNKSHEELQSKYSSLQQNYLLLRAQEENKASKYEAEAKKANKRIHELEGEIRELATSKEGLENKIRGLERSARDGMAMFDEEVKNLKAKMMAAEDRYNQIYVELELVKNNYKMLQQENSRLETKLLGLTDRLEEKA